MYTVGMKATHEVTITSPRGSSHTAVLDFTNDIITCGEDIMRAVEKYRMENIYRPHGMWLTINQAYELAKEQLQATAYNETHKEKLDAKEFAYELETFMGINVYIQGRDA